MTGRYDIIVIGGGLSGLISANLLSRSGRKVLLIEKKKYPFHKVCGEYVSNEVLDFLQSIGFDPFKYGASSISRLRVSTPYGKNIYIPLDLGAFGISRYVMDHALAELAVTSGVTVLTGVKVSDVQSSSEGFHVFAGSAEYAADFVIGSYGKRDMLDKKLQRSFIQDRTGYLAVKYHVKTSYPADEIGLDSFRNGYCGIVKIEDDLYNLCYLYKRSSTPVSIDWLQEKVLFSNPVLKEIFHHAEFVFEEPLAINEISFRKKTISENHIVMCGDSAGLIAPLCGNGMSMAIQSARLLTDCIIRNSSAEKKISSEQRSKIETAYSGLWKQQFSTRLKTGRTLQRLFGNPAITSAVLNCIHFIPPIEKWLIRNTHGKPF
jgi:flavin-dependent dehydrogenase